MTATADERSEKDKLVAIRVNNQSVEVPQHTTGAAIKQQAGVDAGFKLYRKEGANLTPIGDQEEITVHEGETFVAVSGQDVS